MYTVSFNHFNVGLYNDSATFLLGGIKQPCRAYFNSTTINGCLFVQLFLTIAYLLLMNLCADLCWFRGIRTRRFWKLVREQKREGVVKLSMCFCFLQLYNYLPVCWCWNRTLGVVYCSCLQYCEHMVLWVLLINHNHYWVCMLKRKENC